MPLKEYRMTVYVFWKPCVPGRRHVRIHRCSQRRTRILMKWLCIQQRQSWWYTPQWEKMLPTWWRELTWLWKNGYNWSFTRFFRIWNQCRWSFSLTISQRPQGFWNSGDKPVQRSLGISGDINPDVFTFIFKISSDQKPFTRREVLSTINRLFEPPPLGFASPVTVQGNILFWHMLQTSSGTDWDNPFDDSIRF